MNTTTKSIAPWLAAAAIGATIGLAPIASADTDPGKTYGTDPMTPAIFGYHVSNEVANPTNSTEDVPF